MSKKPQEGMSWEEYEEKHMAEEKIKASDKRIRFSLALISIGENRD